MEHWSSPFSRFVSTVHDSNTPYSFDQRCPLSRSLVQAVYVPTLVQFFQVSQVHKLRGLGILCLGISAGKVAQYRLHTFDGRIRLGRDFAAVEIISLFDDFLIVGLEIFSQNSKAKISIGLIRANSSGSRQQGCKATAICSSQSKG
jgi:hypothetical protein